MRVKFGEFRRRLGGFDIRDFFKKREMLAALGTAVKDALGEHIEFHDWTRLHGATMRVSGRSVGSGEFRSFIVKRMVARARGASYRPEDEDPHGLAFRLFNEWAALDFLAELDRSISPNLISGDRSQGLLLIEDLGVNEVEEILNEKNISRATEFFMLFASVLGKLHGSTLGEYENFYARRLNLGPFGSQLARVKGTREWFERILSMLHENLSYLDQQEGQGFWGELEEAGSILSPEDPFYCLTHGDLGVDNVVFHDQDCRLIDFEYSSFRNLFLDAVFPRMAFPGCWYSRSLPDSIVLMWEQEYRQSLEKANGRPIEQALFQRYMVSACVIWTVAALAFGLRRPASLYGQESLLQKDRRWGLVNSRQIFLARLRIAIDTLGVDENFPYVLRHFRAFLSDLELRWPKTKTVLPTFPAFEGRSLCDTPKACL